KVEKVKKVLHLIQEIHDNTNNNIDDNNHDKIDDNNDNNNIGDNNDNNSTEYYLQFGESNY
ncbi:885_t:CDS:1, partial [Cetraspora pellucida]